MKPIESFIVELRSQKVILDSDIAKIYGVETRDINKAVKNNLDKFPQGYIFEISKKELENLRGKFPLQKSQICGVIFPPQKSQICGQKIRPQNYHYPKPEFYPKLSPKKACIC